VGIVHVVQKSTYCRLQESTSARIGATPWGVGFKGGKRDSKVRFYFSGVWMMFVLRHAMFGHDQIYLLSTGETAFLRKATLAMVEPEKKRKAQDQIKSRN